MFVGSGNTQQQQSLVLLGYAYAYSTLRVSEATLTRTTQAKCIKVLKNKVG